MKKFLSILILPLVALGCLYGCGNNRTVADIKKLYLTTIDEHKEEGNRIFFSSDTNEYEINIVYPESLSIEIDNDSPSNEAQKRYRGLWYQQKILSNIFAYYTNHQEEFFRVAGSKDIDKDTLNNLYNKLDTLNTTLDEFLTHYNTFMDVANMGVSNIMKHNVTRYTYQLNKVIDASFNFMYSFHNVYSKYCIDKYNSYSAVSIQTYIDKAYLDMSYVVYLENIKAFNFSGSENGVCDLAVVVNSDSEFNILGLLDSDRKTVSAKILGNLLEGDAYYDETKEKLDEFAYSRDVFDQKLTSYKATYNSIDIKTLSDYKFDDVSGVDYEDYINSMSPSKRATVAMLKNFVQDNFKNYMNNLEKLFN